MSLARPRLLPQVLGWLLALLVLKYKYWRNDERCVLNEMGSQFTHFTGTKERILVLKYEY